MSARVITLPEEYSAVLEPLLKSLGFSLSQPEKLATLVKKLSDHYTLNPTAATPWQEPWAQAASLAYYFPLNYARNRAVATEARRLGFDQGLKSLRDFGSGMGAGLHAWIDTLESSPLAEFEALDISQTALELGQSLRRADSRTFQSRAFDLKNQKSAKLENPKENLILASYVLTELDSIPSFWLDAEAIAILEPSTQEDARRLMSWRQNLIDLGFQVWAPCTHMGACPLLTQSEKDWCHDRIHFSPPEWFQALEKHLPMKNRTLTFSYLLARKTKPPESLAQFARLTGDMLEEKGKTRQSLCRGPEREFLTWFPQRLKKNEVIEMHRGNLVRFHAEPEKKSSEVRFRESKAVEEIDSNQQID